MVAIRPLQRLRPNNNQILSTLVVLALTLGVFAMAQHGSWWPYGMAWVLVVEYAALKWLVVVGARTKRLEWPVSNWLPVVAGLGAVLTIAMLPRLASQVAVALIYGAWRWWWQLHTQQRLAFMHVLFVEFLAFEGLFLSAAVWRTPDWVVMAAVWLVAWVSAYAVLAGRKERSAQTLAAAWGLVAAQLAGVLLIWLFTYTSPKGYVLVPQPVVVLLAVGYCFGNIYLSARQGSLSRSRLAEYLVIGGILIAMVVAGTSWKGTL